MNNDPQQGNSAIIFVIAIAIIGSGAYWFYGQPSTPSPKEVLQRQSGEPRASAPPGTTTVAGEVASAQRTGTSSPATTTLPVTVSPIMHASMVLTWDGTTIYVDPVGDSNLYEKEQNPDLILLTDTDEDHLSSETLTALSDPSVSLIAPQAVYDALPQELALRTVVLENGGTTTFSGISIEAVPMYNLPEQDTEIWHERGRGTGHVPERSGERVYIAGDTADTPEMRALTDIDMAFVPMNPPYTMSVARAADAVNEFKPRVVYPYHFRTPEGFSDVEHFRSLVEESGSGVEVRLLDWYPETDEDGIDS